MWPFKRKTLDDVLNATVRIKAGGVVFRIKKIDALSFMDGSNAIMQIYQTYEDRKDSKKVKTDEEKARDNDRLRKHFSDVFLAGVVEPKLCRKKDDKSDGIPVDNLFTDWGLVNDLYQKIMEYSYGKKKM